MNFPRYGLRVDRARRRRAATMVLTEPPDQLALERWENEGGADAAPRSGRAPATDIELVQLRVRLIAR